VKGDTPIYPRTSLEKTGHNLILCINDMTARSHVIRTLGVVKLTEAHKPVLIIQRAIPDADDETRFVVNDPLALLVLTPESLPLLSPLVLHEVMLREGAFPIRAPLFELERWIRSLPIKVMFDNFVAPFGSSVHEAINNFITGQTIYDRERADGEAERLTLAAALEDVSLSLHDKTLDANPVVHGTISLADLATYLDRDKFSPFRARLAESPTLPVDTDFATFLTNELGQDKMVGRPIYYRLDALDSLRRLHSQRLPMETAMMQAPRDFLEFAAGPLRELVDLQLTNEADIPIRDRLHALVKHAHEHPIAEKSLLVALLPNGAEKRVSPLWEKLIANRAKYTGLEQARALAFVLSSHGCTADDVLWARHHVSEGTLLKALRNAPWSSEEDTALVHAIWPAAHATLGDGLYVEFARVEVDDVAEGASITAYELADELGHEGTREEGSDLAPGCCFILCDRHAPKAYIPQRVYTVSQVIMDATQKEGQETHDLLERLDSYSNVTIIDAHMLTVSEFNALARAIRTLHGMYDMRHTIDEAYFAGFPRRSLAIRGVRDLLPPMARGVTERPAYPLMAALRQRKIGALMASDLVERHCERINDQVASDYAQGPEAIDEAMQQPGAVAIFILPEKTEARSSLKKMLLKKRGTLATVPELVAHVLAAPHAGAPVCVFANSRDVNIWFTRDELWTVVWLAKMCSSLHLTFLLDKSSEGNTPINLLRAALSNETRSPSNYWT
jgi:hypothetical protein